MALRFEIISAQRQQLGGRANFTLAGKGCRIGRSLDNDWALPDVSRFLSGHHAIIHFRVGLYFLEDTSTNGVYINDSVSPLGRRGVQALLHAGDILRLGDYRIMVHIEEEAKPQPQPLHHPPQHQTPVQRPDTQEMAALTVENVLPVRLAKGRRIEANEGIDFSALIPGPDATASLRRMGVARQTKDGDLGDSLTIESLLPPDAADLAAKIEATATWRVLPSLAAAMQQPAPDSTLPPPPPPPPPRTPPPALVESNDSTGSRQLGSGEDRLSRLRAAAKARLEGTNSQRLLELRGGLDAFLRGAGVDPERLSVQNEVETLQVAGRLLREALLGLKEILRAQQTFLDSNRIEAEAPEGRSPLETNADDYLLELLAGHEKRRLDAVLRLRDQFAHAGKHGTALSPALRDALTQFLSHLAPERIGVGSGDAASWLRYKEIYGNLLQARSGRLPHLFLEALAQAYLAAREKDRR
jgi:type VI secretion system protein